MAEEATNGNPWLLDTRAMGSISRAAFEVDDYWTIVGILHKRFNWVLAVMKKSARELKLLEKGPPLKEEKDLSRNLTRGTLGFVSFCQRSFSKWRIQGVINLQDATPSSTTMK